MHRNHDDHDFLFEGESTTIKGYALVTGETFKNGRYTYRGPSIVWKTELSDGNVRVKKEYINDPSIWAWLQAQIELKQMFEDKLKEVGEENFVDEAYAGLHKRQDELINQHKSRNDRVKGLTDSEKVDKLIRSRLHKSSELLRESGLERLAEKLDNVDRKIENEIA